MHKERLTVSLEPRLAARTRQCGARIPGGASAYLERLVRQDELSEAVAVMARWEAAHGDPEGDLLESETALSQEGIE